MQRLLLIFLFASAILSCSEKEQHEWHPQLIAHAGGAIDGRVYTNSLEALENAVAAGYRFVEFDLAFTLDSVLVATHSWSDFNAQSGFPAKGDSVPLYADFVSRKLYGKYTPLTAHLIDSVFVNNPQLFLVTDKISDADVLESYFPALKQRMVVEAFNYNDYVELKRRGYFALYSCIAGDMVSTVLSHMLLHRLFDGERVEWMALHTSAFDNLFFKFVDAFCNYNAALYTVNDLSAVPNRYRNKVKMIYTDSILP